MSYTSALLTHDLIFVRFISRETFLGKVTNRRAFLREELLSRLS